MSKNIYFGLFTLIYLCFAYFLLQSPDVIWFNEHMTRDVSRAHEWLELAPSSWWGAEMGWESNRRLPGPFFTLLLAVGGGVSGSVFSMVVFKSLISLACISTLVFVIYRRFSLVPTLIFSALFLSSPLSVMVMRNLWNPSFLVPLLALHYALMLVPPGGKVAKLSPWLNGFILFASVQVHFSALFPLLISSAVFCLTNRRLKDLLISVGPVALLLLVWILLADEAQFAANTQAQYEVRFEWDWWRTRLLHARYHFFPSHDAIYNYDLFNFLGFLSRHFFQGSIDSLVNAYEKLSYLFWPMTFISLCLVSWRSAKAGFLWRPVVVIFWLLLCLFIYIQVAYNVGPHVPYRYGLIIYPLQFLVWAIAAHELMQIPRMWAKTLLITLVLISVTTAGLNFFWLSDLDRSMKLSGRSHHGPNDSFTVTLRSKLQVLSILRKHNPHTKDLWRCVHGRLAQRMRVDDMTWNQVTRWHALDREYPPLSPSVDECASHWFLSDGYGDKSIFRWHKIKSDDFSLSINQLAFKDEKIIAQKKLAPDKILPAEHLASADSVVLHFKIKRQPTLYLLIDLAQPQFIFAEPRLEIEDQVIDLPCLTRRAEFLVSSQCSVSLENFKKPILEGRLFLKLNQRPPHHARIELFGMKELLREGY